MAVGAFTRAILATLWAIVAKLMTSIDDLIWLVPFVSEPKEISKRIIFGIVYIIVMSILNILAIIVASVGESVLKYFAENNEYWDGDRILSVVAGTFLLVYSLYLFCDWRNKKNEIEYFKTDTDGYESETPNMLSNSMTISNIDNDSDSTDDINNNGIEMAPLDDENSDQKENKTEDSTQIIVPPSSTTESSEQKTPANDDKIIADESISEIQEDISLLVDKNDNKQDTKAINSEETNNNHNILSPGNDDENNKNELETIKTNNDSNIDDLEENNDNIITNESSKKINVVTIPRLCVISTLGGMDDFSVHVGMLLAKVYTPWELMIGVLIGSVIVIFFSIFLSIIKPIARLINKIPIWLIIFCIANYRLISAFAEK